MKTIRLNVAEGADALVPCPKCKRVADLGIPLNDLPVTTSFKCICGMQCLVIFARRKVASEDPDSPGF